MTTPNLSNYDLGELKGLHLEIEREIKGRQRQEVTKAREQILAIAQDLGLSVKDLLADTGSKTKGGSGKKVQAQYHNPADKLQTWTGRGRKPKWMVDGLASGKTVDHYRI